MTEMRGTGPNEDAFLDTLPSEHKEELKRLVEKDLFKNPAALTPTKDRADRILDELFPGKRPPADLEQKYRAAIKQLLEG